MKMVSKSLVYALAFLFGVMLVSSVVSGFFHKEKPQLAPNPSTDVQLQVGNAAPIVTVIWVDDNIVEQNDNVDLNPGGVQAVTIEFNVEDPNGPPATNLNPATLDISFDLDAGGETASTLGDGACDPPIDVVNVRTYTCRVNMDFFSDDGAWTATVQIEDNAVVPLTGSDTHSFTVAPLLHISITTPIAFGVVAAGANDVLSTGPTTVTNNGNFIVPTDGNIEILSGALGSSPPGDTISATQFTAGGSGVTSDVCLTTPGEGTSLVDGFSPIPVTSASLVKGASATENINYCLDVPSVAEEVYSAVEGDGVWTIQIA
jgi:hypothetical protein